ncbi:Hypothetical predicted protein [Olea europaea subsp. europaea]|uniref:Uncharacterized protein n=1 Tax=Olea europaea subsp. europaea TaxID=158383 RepID=A0A8S0VEI7_OLEEU|nr:Hypothetical predicted protein [Olea europaea subsp. europaea]
MHNQPSEWGLASVFNSSSAYASIASCCRKGAAAVLFKFSEQDPQNHGCGEKTGAVPHQRISFVAIGVVEWVVGVERREVSVERREGGEGIGLDSNLVVSVFHGMTWAFLVIVTLLSETGGTR